MVIRTNIFYSARFQALRKKQFEWRESFFFFFPLQWYARQRSSVRRRKQKMRKENRFITFGRWNDWQLPFCYDFLCESISQLNDAWTLLLRAWIRVSRKKRRVFVRISREWFRHSEKEVNEKTLSNSFSVFRSMFINQFHIFKRKFPTKETTTKWTSFARLYLSFILALVNITFLYLIFCSQTVNKLWEKC